MNASLDCVRQGRGGGCGSVPETGSAGVSLNRGSGFHYLCRDTQSVGWTAASSLFRHSNPRGLGAGGNALGEFKSLAGKASLRRHVV